MDVGIGNLRWIGADTEGHGLEKPPLKHIVFLGYFSKEKLLKVFLSAILATTEGV